MASVRSALLPEELDDALRRLAEWPGDRTIRPIILGRYHALASNRRRDADGRLRWLLLRALRGLVTADDAQFLVEATRTFEYMPAPLGEIGHGIRAEALSRLDEVDPGLARWRAVEMLSDPDHNSVSGEPALTAIRLLGSGGDQRLLYSVALANPYDLPSAAAGEALLWLDELPEERLKRLVSRFIETDDPNLLLAVIDLAMERSIDWLDDVVVDALVATTQEEAFRYAVLQAAARHREGLIGAVVQLLSPETGRWKLVIAKEHRTQG